MDTTSAAANLLELAAAADNIPFRAKTNYVHSTWSRTYSSMPELYIQPESLEEVQKVVRMAATCRRRVTTTGCGHSPSDITCTSSWMVNLDNFNKVVSVDKESGIAVVDAGIRLFQLSEELDKHGLALPNLGSINEQSVAGVISTGTHGSSLRHGLVSDMVEAIQIVLADGSVKKCKPSKEGDDDYDEENNDLFRGALLSLGALGIISQVTIKAVPAFALKWKQVVDRDAKMFAFWDKTLWTHAEFVRVWWFPYTRRAVVWSADKTDEKEKDPPMSYYDRAVGYYVYHNLLALAQLVPRMLPWVEWFVFGMQYGFKDGTTVEGVQPSRKALLMNCLYSQFVNEWAIPLEKGPEALTRLGAWLNRLKPGDPGYVEHGIPVSAEGLWVHAPVEVRASDTGIMREERRPLLDNSMRDGPTLYLNATLYRPYHMDPPCRERYYQGFEWLMKDLRGSPHWAKNFEVGREEIEEFFGSSVEEEEQGLEKWRDVREDVDPMGMFAGPWHRRNVLDGEKLELEEVETGREKAKGGGVMVMGSRHS